MWSSAPPPQANEGSNKVAKVQLFLYASNLRKAGVFASGAPDPYAIVTLLSNNPTEKPTVLGKTETVKTAASPKWTSTFLLDYHFGQATRINVGVYDEEQRRGRDSKPLGSALFEIGEILAARGNTKAKLLKNGGTVFARVLRPPEIDAGTLNLALRGVQLKNLDGIFGKSDPFFEVSSQADSAGGLTWQPVYRSQPVMNNLNPTWPRASININTLCQGDKNRPILIAVKDWERNGGHKQMGSFETSVNALLGAVTAGGNAKNIDTSRAFSLTSKGKTFGKIVVIEANVVGGGGPSNSHSSAAYAQGPPAYGVGGGGAMPDFSQSLSHPVGATIPAMTGYDPTEMVAPLPPPLAPPLSRPTFVDYLSGGCELQMCVAIDFTGSNGDPRKPGTLHYIHHDGQLNDYEKAVTAVGSIIARYDSDQKFPVWGFGAKFGGVIQHCFQVGPTSELSGIRGILDGYRNVFKSGLTMSGPTVFAEVIDVAAAQARSKQEAASRIGKQAYTILIILTDGAVTDVELTKRAIIAASNAPLSIVIVGIGHADFSAMQFLDDVANSPGCGRDICQFVEFSRYQYDKNSLTRETLAEIPDQVVDYFVGNGIQPLPPISGSLASIVPDQFNEDEDIDLSIEQRDDGQVTLTHTAGAVYDDTHYGSLADHMGDSRPAPFRPAGAGSSASTSSYDASVPTVVAGNTYNPNAPTVHAQQSSYQQGPPSSYQPSGSMSAPYQSSGSVHSSYHPPQQQAYQPGGSSPYQPSQGNVYGSQGGGSIPTVVAAAPAKMFNVQVPPGCGPGTQLQVRNPETQQMQIVTIPHGVPPGGVFPVHY